MDLSLQATCVMAGLCCWQRLVDTCTMCLTQKRNGGTNDRESPGVTKLTHLCPTVNNKQAEFCKNHRRCIKVHVPGPVLCIGPAHKDEPRQGWSQMGCRNLTSAFTHTATPGQNACTCASAVLLTLSAAALSAGARSGGARASTACLSCTDMGTAGRLLWSWMEEPDGAASS